MEEINIKIYGQVHGVGFRYYARLEALKLGLVGFVQNLPDGSVEIVAQGPKADLEKLVDWAKFGPRSAAVEKIDIAWSEAQAFRYSTFEIY